MLQDLIIKHFGDDKAKMEAFLEDMKANKIYTASEENLDTRYTKLKGDFDALTSQKTEADNLIEQLKGENKGNQELQTKITEYEGKITTLEAENEKLAIETDLKVKLLERGAKADNMDFLLFKASQGEELKRDKDGHVKGIDALIDGLVKNYSSSFEEKAKKKVDVLKHDDDQHEDESTITKEQFDKMSYAQKNKLYNENKELYDQLKGE